MFLDEASALATATHSLIRRFSTREDEMSSTSLNISPWPPATPLTPRSSKESGKNSSRFLFPDYVFGQRRSRSIAAVDLTFERRDKATQTVVRMSHLSDFDMDVMEDMDLDADTGDDVFLDKKDEGIKSSMENLDRISEKSERKSDEGSNAYQQDGEEGSTFSATTGSSVLDATEQQLPSPHTKANEMFHASDTYSSGDGHGASLSSADGDHDELGTKKLDNPDDAHNMDSDEKDALSTSVPGIGTGSNDSNNPTSHEAGNSPINHGLGQLNDSDPSAQQNGAEAYEKDDAMHDHEACTMLLNGAAGDLWIEKHQVVDVIASEEWISGSSLPEAQPISHEENTSETTDDNNGTRKELTSEAEEDNSSSSSGSESNASRLSSSSSNESEDDALDNLQTTDSIQQEDVRSTEGDNSEATTEQSQQQQEPYGDKHSEMLQHADDHGYENDSSKDSSPTSTRLTHEPELMLIDGVEASMGALLGPTHAHGCEAPDVPSALDDSGFIDMDGHHIGQLQEPSTNAVISTDSSSQETESVKETADASNTELQHFDGVQKQEEKVDLTDQHAERDEASDAVATEATEKPEASNIQSVEFPTELGLSNGHEESVTPHVEDHKTSSTEAMQDNHANLTSADSDQESIHSETFPEHLELKLDEFDDGNAEDNPAYPRTGTMSQWKDFHETEENHTSEAEDIICEATAKPLKEDVECAIQDEDHVHVHPSTKSPGETSEIHESTDADVIPDDSETNQHFRTSSDFHNDDNESIASDASLETFEKLESTLEELSTEMEEMKPSFPIDEETKAALEEFRTNFVNMEAALQEIKEHTADALSPVTEEGTGVEENEPAAMDGYMDSMNVTAEDGLDQPKTTTPHEENNKFHCGDRHPNQQHLPNAHESVIETAKTPEELEPAILSAEAESPSGHLEIPSAETVGSDEMRKEELTPQRKSSDVTFPDEEQVVQVSQCASSATDELQLSTRMEEQPQTNSYEHDDMLHETEEARQCNGAEVMVISSQGNENADTDASPETFEKLESTLDELASEMEEMEPSFPMDEETQAALDEFRINFVHMQATVQEIKEHTIDGESTMNGNGTFMQENTQEAELLNNVRSTTWPEEALIEFGSQEMVRPLSNMLENDHKSEQDVFDDAELTINGAELQDAGTNEDKSVSPDGSQLGFDKASELDAEAKIEPDPAHMRMIGTIGQNVTPINYGHDDTDDDEQPEENMHNTCTITVEEDQLNVEEHHKSLAEELLEAEANRLASETQQTGLKEIKVRSKLNSVESTDENQDHQDPSQIAQFASLLKHKEEIAVPLRNAETDEFLMEYIQTVEIVNSICRRAVSSSVSREMLRQILRTVQHLPHMVDNNHDPDFRILACEVLKYAAYISVKVQVFQGVADFGTTEAFQEIQDMFRQTAADLLIAGDLVDIAHRLICDTNVEENPDRARPLASSLTVTMEDLHRIFWQIARTGNSDGMRRILGENRKRNWMITALASGAAVTLAGVTKRPGMLFLGIGGASYFLWSNHNINQLLHELKMLDDLREELCRETERLNIGLHDESVSEQEAFEELGKLKRSVSSFLS